MIKLTEKTLVNYIIVDDQRFFLDTDFRLWVDYPKRLKSASEGNFEPLVSIFVGSVPPITEDTITALNNFYYEKTEIPRVSDSKSVELMDYEYDSDYIFAGFWQAYGIDLTETDMHWHKFLALLNGLPDDTMMVKIMRYRGYEGSSKDPGHDDYIKLREMWALPTRHTAEEQQKIDEFNEYFG